MIFTWVICLSVVANKYRPGKTNSTPELTTYLRQIVLFSRLQLPGADKREQSQWCLTCSQKDCLTAEERTTCDLMNQIKKQLISHLSKEWDATSLNSGKTLECGTHYSKWWPSGTNGTSNHSSLYKGPPANQLKTEESKKNQATFAHSLVLCSTKRSWDAAKGQDQWLHQFLNPEEGAKKET